MAAQSYSVKSDAQLLLLLEIGTTSGFFLFAYKRGTGEDKPRGKALPAPQLAPGSVIWTALVVAASCMAHSALSLLRQWKIRSDARPPSARHRWSHRRHSPSIQAYPYLLRFLIAQADVQKRKDFLGVTAHNLMQRGQLLIADDYAEFHQYNQPTIRYHGLYDLRCQAMIVA